MTTATQARPPSVADGKQTSEQKVRRRRVWPFVLVGVLLLALAGGAVWLVGFSSVLAAQRVEIGGLRRWRSAQVTDGRPCRSACRWPVRTSTAIADRVRNLPAGRHVVG